MSTEMKYIHPHSESRIIDNAVLTVSASGLSNKFIALEAEKGMPNEATYISSPSEYTFNFGEPNFNKYGQSGLNAIQWLRPGGGLCRRRAAELLRKDREAAWRLLAEVSRPAAADG